MAKVYLGLGSNLNQPIRQVLSAIDTLGLYLTQLRSAPLYRTRPIGPPGQPKYINTVIEGDIHLQPIQLLDLCQHVEESHKRVRGVHWGPRTLDIDILYYDNQQFETTRLTLPHPEIFNRDFVVIPLINLIKSRRDPLGRELDITRYNQNSMELIKVDKDVI